MSATDSQTAVHQAILLSFVIMKVLECGSYVLNVYIHHNACDTRNHRMRMQVFEHVLRLTRPCRHTRGCRDTRWYERACHSSDWLECAVHRSAFLKLVLTVFHGGYQYDYGSGCVLKSAVISSGCWIRRTLRKRAAQSFAQGKH